MLGIVALAMLQLCFLSTLNGQKLDDATQRFNDKYDCGVPPIPPDVKEQEEKGISKGLIHEGKEAKPHSWPWMVLTSKLVKGSNGQRRKWGCGGSIISRNAVLTAAHCVESHYEISQMQLHFGLHDKKNVEKQQVVTRSALYSKVYVHPKYHRHSTEYDVAVIVFDPPIDYGETIQPVCLPTHEYNNTAAGQSAYATGWGTLMRFGPPSETLQQVKVKFYNGTGCPTDADIVCFEGFEKRAAGTEYGDSGGPFVQNKNGRWYQYAITSYGFNPEKDQRVAMHCPFFKAVLGDDVCVGGNK